jgi:hypothetical protein
MYDAGCIVWENKGINNLLCTCQSFHCKMPHGHKHTSWIIVAMWVTQVNCLLGLDAAAATSPQSLAVVQQPCQHCSEGKGSSWTEVACLPLGIRKPSAPPPLT